MVLSSALYESAIIWLCMRLKPHASMLSVWDAIEERVKQHRVDSILRRERKKVLRTWMPWAIVTALILCWEVKKSVDEIAAGNFTVPAWIPPCARGASCMPSHK
jgi:predicted nucleic acid-binding Zn ribbon protein